MNSQNVEIILNRNDIIEKTSAKKEDTENDNDGKNDEKSDEVED